MLKNFFTNNIFSVNAQVSFSFFIIGSKITNSYISKVAERTNWIKDEKKILEITRSIVNEKHGASSFNPLSTLKFSQRQKQEWNEARKEAEKLTQGKFTQAQLNKFKIFSGFGMGFLASTIYNDLSTDEDLNYFVQALVSTPEEIEQLILDRQQARKDKNFAIADEIRDLLLAQGIILEDTREGVKWKRA